MLSSCYKTPNPFQDRDILSGSQMPNKGSGLSVNKAELAAYYSCVHSVDMARPVCFGIPCDAAHMLGKGADTDGKRDS